MLPWGTCDSWLRMLCGEWDVWGKCAVRRSSDGLWAAATTVPCSSGCLQDHVGSELGTGCSPDSLAWRLGSAGPQYTATSPRTSAPCPHPVVDSGSQPADQLHGSSRNSRPVGHRSGAGQHHASCLGPSISAGVPRPACPHDRPCAAACSWGESTSSLDLAFLGHQAVTIGVGAHPHFGPLPAWQVKNRSRATLVPWGPGATGCQPQTSTGARAPPRAGF